MHISRCEPVENILGSGLCIFHDEEYLKDLKHKKDHEQKIKNELTKKIEKSEPLLCIGYYLPNFPFEYFKQSVDFSQTVFVGPANFSRARFIEKASFAGTRFGKEADFSEAQFTKESSFAGSHFMEKTSFARTRFGKEADFSEAQFMTEANFLQAQFRGDAKFSGAHFLIENGVTKKAHFSGAHFSGAQFTGRVDFSAQFMIEAKFSGAQFIGLVDFTLARFTSGANFSKAQFTEEANFFEAQFTGGANFFEAQFTGANFWAVQFAGKADFLGAQIKEADFKKARFMKDADFSEIRFTKEAPSRLAFQYVQFDDQEHTFFLTIDLSEVSFINTDISRLRFGEDVVWGDKFKIREEREIEKQLKADNVAIDIHLGDVLAVYRNLRENFEFRMRYDEAERFFIREMEMKRQYEIVSSRSWKNMFRLKWRINNTRLLEERKIVGLGPNDWISRNISLTGLYYHLARYGQSFSRPALFGIGIVLFSTLLWLSQPNPAGDFSFQNITMPEATTILKSNNKTNIEVAFERGLTNFLPSLSFGTELNVGLLDVIFKILGGAVTFGLIIVALRRKFERKFRH